MGHRVRSEDRGQKKEDRWQILEGRRLDAGAKISNPNTQIPNNIQIRKTNFRNITIQVLKSYNESGCFKFWSLVFV